MNENDWRKDREQFKVPFRKEAETGPPPAASAGSVRSAVTEWRNMESRRHRGCPAVGGACRTGCDGVHHR